ncbi:MAG: hypothetical protein Q4B15_05930, partial [Lachnospiraceae bacterium]|nr:hypothetical protein [Lachnospiraceae bacterium]
MRRQVYPDGSRYLGVGKDTGADEVLTYVFAPALLGISKWILKTAEERGIRKLFFLARDGYSICETVRYLVCLRGAGPELHMLYVSRYTLRIPFYADDPEEAVDRICGGETILTWRRIFLRSGFDELISDKMRKVLSVRDPDRPLSKKEIKKIRVQLRDDPFYLKKLTRCSRKARICTEAYLEKEGFFCDEKVGIIDSGWSGYTQLLLDKMRKQQGIRERTEGFYFGLKELPEALEADAVHCFFFEPRDIRKKGDFRCSVLEAVLCPPFGTVLGYEEKNAVPILAGDPESERHGRITDAVLRETKRLADADQTLPLSTERLRKYSFAGMRLFMRSPTRKEAENLGTLLFSGEMTDRFQEELAPVLVRSALNKRLLAAGVLRGLSLMKPLDRAVCWPEGTLRRSTGCDYIFRKA